MKELSYFEIEGSSEKVLLPTPAGAKTPDEICSTIFRELLESARSDLKEQVYQAVIAFPANFNVKQRSAIRQAAENAGWQVMRTVAEPTAAAFSNQSEAGDDEVEIVGVFDFGGGTFDISIVAIDKFGIYEVIATDGDPFLGGEDLDFRLQTYALEQIGIDRSQLSSSSLYELKLSCEKAKILLSSQNTSKIEVSEQIRAIRPNITAYIDISRDLFSDLIQDLVDRSINICRSIFGNLAYYGKTISVDDLDRIVLVGGSTRIPTIQDTVERFFGKTPDAQARREDAVALGCAIYAGVLEGSRQDRILLDATSASISMELPSGDLQNVIERNTTAPAVKDIDIYIDLSDGCTQHLRVFHGNSLSVLTDYHIGDVMITPLKKAEGEQHLTVTFDLNVDGNLIVDERRPSPKRNVYFQPTALTKTAAIDNAELHTTYRVLSVATEWKSGKGGINTFNRNLCIGLASLGHEVCCLVTDPSAQDVQAADQNKIRLIAPRRSPGMSHEVILARRVDLPSGFRAIMYLANPANLG